MKYAIISDIHANLAALTAVLADIDQQRDVKEIWCLGDIIGYGPDPLECYQLVRERCSLIIKGNHEKGLEVGGADKFNAIARLAIEWTHNVIKKSPKGAQILADIAATPTSFERNSMLFVHGSPMDPTSEYLLPDDAARVKKMQAQFALFQNYCFVGHTHHPGVFEENITEFNRPEAMMHNIYFLDNACKAIINVGSVGQPRDHNPHAGYVTFLGDSVRYHRVAYEVEVTRQKIYAIPELNDKLAERLVVGK